MRGRFIVLEGPDGSGTTTHAALLAKNLQKNGIDTLLTAEPTNGPIGVFIRQELQKGALPPSALQLLFTADRAWHVDTVLQQALEAGKTVISDRYSLSTLIYGSALGLFRDWLENMNKYFIQPDVQIILLPSFETCFQRMSNRGAKDILESQDSLQRSVYDGYVASAHQFDIPAVDTAGSLELAAEKILQCVLTHSR